MFVTGKYNFRNYETWGILNPNEKTFATLMKDAGYNTFVTGKWQFDGGDASIHSLGFDSYSVWNPIKDDQSGSHYKDPKIYENGAYLDPSLTKGKYGDDIFTDNLLSFVKENKSNPFFIYYPMGLCHFPYSPTPDDPEFDTWDPAVTNDGGVDTLFFASMVKYTDKKVGQIIDSLKAWNLYDNTIILFSGDNGTPHHIHYTYNGQPREGGKSTTSEVGTHVPLIVNWPSGIRGEKVNNNLVDFTDILPTVAEAAQASIPASYGTIDGVSFYKQLKGLPSTPRDWVFCHFAPETNAGNDKIKRWIQNTNYKLYDSTDKFYNIALDPEENTPLNSSDLTPDEKALKRKFKTTMDGLH